MSDDRAILNQAANALKEGDKAEARRILKPLLRSNPSADAWFLAANAMDDDAQAITCLKKALELDEWHAQANRMLLKLEEPDMHSIPDRTPVEQVDVPTLPELKRKPNTREQEREKRRRLWRSIGCIGTLLLSFTCSAITFSLIGLVPGLIGVLVQLTGGPPPITELDGIPIEDVPNAALFIEPSVDDVASDQQVEVIDHGYVHQYTFDARNGEEIAIYIQFLSLSASNVAGNTVVLNPDGAIEMPGACISLGEAGLLGGQGNITINCNINATGEWRVRVLGVEGESVGAYFAGVERIGGR